MSKHIEKEEVTVTKVTKVIYTCDCCETLTEVDSDYDNFKVSEVDGGREHRIIRQSIIALETTEQSLSLGQYETFTREKWDICPNCFERRIRPFLNVVCANNSPRIEN